MFPYFFSKKNQNIKSQFRQKIYEKHYEKLPRVYNSRNSKRRTTLTSAFQRKGENVKKSSSLLVSAPKVNQAGKCIKRCRKENWIEIAFIVLWRSEDTIMLL